MSRPTTVPQSVQKSNSPCPRSPRPKLLILDEAVAALDVSIQAQILNLLAEVRRQTQLSYLLITHDLAVVRQLTDRSLVMQHGEIVERGPTLRLLDQPQHPYTKLLRSSIPRPGWKPARRARTGSGATALNRE